MFLLHEFLCTGRRKLGLDVALDVENHYTEVFPHLPTHARDLLQSYVDAGKLGIKSGEGFYTY